MTATIDTARDDIYSLLKTAWDSGSKNIAGEIPKIYWDGVNVPKSPDPSSYFAIAEIKHNPASNHMLAVDGVSRSRVEFFGVVTVAIRAPVKKGNAAQKAVQLGRLVLTAFTGRVSSNRVWFRNPAVIEAGVSDHWFQVNVVIDFTYDDFF